MTDQEALHVGASQRGQLAIAEQRQNAEHGCTITPGCGWPRHDAAAHPCGSPHIPGSPCTYCRKPTPGDGGPCPGCWTPIPPNLADAKALLALAGLSVSPTAQPCCGMHSEHCEPLGDLCCGSCTEAAHNTFPIRHADGSKCVLDDPRGNR